MAADQSDQIRRRRVAKGRRPFFFADANTDKLLAIIAALAGEVAVLRQRLDTHERIAGQHGIFSPTDVEDFSPSVEVTDERALWRQEFLQRVFRILELDYTQPEVLREESAYSRMIEEFAAPPTEASRLQSSGSQHPQRRDKAEGKARAARPKQGR